MLFLVSIIVIIIWIPLHTSKAEIINVPNDYSTIQEAIDASEAGDVIEVGPSYIEDLHITINKPVTLREKVNETVKLKNVYVNSDNVIIDGFITEAYFIINIADSSSCTIKNIVGTFWMEISNSYNISIENCNKIEDAGNYSLLRLINSDNCNLILNIFTELHLINSSFIKMKNNEIDSNFMIVGSDLNNYMHDINNSNILNSKPICYYKNINNAIISPINTPDSDFIAIINSTNVQIKNESIKSGILVSYSNNTLINNCKGPLFVVYSNNVSLFDNHCVFDIKHSNKIIIVNNKVEVLPEYDTRSVMLHGALSSSRITDVAGCKLYNNVMFDLLNFIIDKSKNLIVERNNFSKNERWRIQRVIISESFNGTFKSNVITDAYFSLSEVYLWKFSYNNFIDTNINVGSLDMLNSNINWDDGYLRGNYWSDYNSTDEYSGPYLEKTGADGIWDTPYQITYRGITSVFDNYPFVKPIPNIDLIYRPIIKTVTLSNIKPRSFEQVTITASILSYNEIQDIILTYSEGISWYNVSMRSENGEYIGSIPNQENGTTVTFKIYVNDIEGNWVLSETYNYSVFDKSPLEFYSVLISPEEPQTDEMFEVEVKIASKDEDISASWVILSYRGADMQWWNTTAESIGDGRWTIRIPGQPIESELQFCIYAFDDSGDYIKSEIYRYNITNPEETSNGLKIPGFPLVSISTGFLLSILVIILVRSQVIRLGSYTRAQ